MAEDTIDSGKVVTFHYTLKNATGDVIDSSKGKDPLPYLHGAGNIVPGLEKQLVGQTVGDTLEAKVEPAEGYGERQGPGEQKVPRTAFPEDAAIQPGMPVGAQTPDGQQVMLWITRIEEEAVFVDNNHPLAGETLHFDVEIVDIRDATDEEKQHGHPHVGEHAH